MLTGFDMVLEQARSAAVRRPRVVVAGAATASAVSGGFECVRAGLATPVFVEREDRFRTALAQGDWAGLDYELIPCGEGEDPCVRAAALVASGGGECLMKGSVETSEFMKPILDRKNGLRSEGVLSLISLIEMPDYGKLMAHTDSAILPFPTPEQRFMMAKNCVDTLHRLGVPHPNVALLSALEFETKAIPDTLEAAALVRRWEAGELPGCNLAGPISYDLIMSPESAAIKGYECPWCGQFDAIVSPNIVVGNTLTKCLSISSKTPQAGIVAGARVPVVLTSRSMDAGDRMRSMAMALAVAVGP